MTPNLVTRLAYGMGSVAFGAKLQLLNLLLLFYNQVLGLPAAAVSTVLAVSIVLEAVWDPIVGYMSDHTRTRLGRRHPYLYGVAVPLAIAVALLWAPPSGMSETELLIWLIVFAIATRFLITLHEIPSSALLPELTRDYHARTNLVSIRWFFFTCGAAIMTVLTYGVFLKSSAEHPFGQLNRAGYAPLGATIAIIMMIAIFASALGTHRQIPKLSAAPVRDGGIAATFRAIAATLANWNFMIIALSGLIYGINRGINDGLRVYVGTYFWQLPSEKLLWWNLMSLPASFAAALIAPALSRRFGKRQSCVAVFIAAVVTGNLVYAAALLGLMPAPGTSAQLTILLADRFVEIALGVAGFIIVSSMIADIVEEVQVRTGKRSEGLLFAADTFLQKLISGVASILPGVLLALVTFPPKADPKTLDPQIMHNLIWILMPLTFALGIAATVVLVWYRIDKRAHEMNLAKLAAQTAPGE
jgi:glycoside/pentoside/hexuronide:cation symporter, GPH family